jgi:hypothetical protein
MASVRTIGDVPFRRRPIDDLLALRGARTPLDAYTGFGYAHATELVLEDARGARGVLRRVLVLAMHAADGGPALPADVELEFVVDEAADDSVVVLASDFLHWWLPRLRAEASPTAVVLALCNPHAAHLGHLAAAADADLYYATSDVFSMWRRDDDRPHLFAQRWRLEGALRAP